METKNVLGDVENGEKLVVYDVLEGGLTDVNVGDVFTVKGVRSRDLAGSGSFPRPRFLAFVETEEGLNARLVSVNGTEDAVYLVSARGGACIRVV